ncbi:MAG: hypothetical protein CR986_07305 [Ignavibacteriae bacterium]|nr:MAG: hypothetical protein CR986_07305 [Ignavibacteriota bacterium]
MKNKIILSLIYLLAFNLLNAQTYNIDEFMELVVKNNKDILIAKKELEIAETQDAMARSGAYPYIQAGANYKRNFKNAYMYADFSGLLKMIQQMLPPNPNPTPPPPGTQTGGASKFKINYKNEFSANASVTQQIFNFSVFKAISAAKQYQKLSGNIFDATMIGIKNGSKKAFYQTLLLKELLNVNKESEKNANENYIELKKKYEVGIASELEMLQAEVRWQNSIPQLTQAERNYQLALNSLKTLAGLKYSDKFEIEGNLDIKQKPLMKIEMADVFNNRPDYKAMVSEKELRETNVGVESAAHYPSLSVSFIYSYAAQSDYFKLERENYFLFGQLNLQVPIFNGWRTTAQVQEAQIQADQVELKIQKFKNSIYTEIKNLELKLNEAEKRINSAKATLGIAKKAFNIAEATTENGLSTQLELKDARLGYDQARLNYLSAMYEYLESYFDWELAVGIAK